MAGLLFHVLGARAAAEDGGVTHALDRWSYALLVLGPVALAFWKRAPVLVLAVAVGASIGVSTFVAPNWMVAVAPVLALFHAVRNGRVRAAIVVVVPGWVIYLLVTRVFADPLGMPEMVRPDLREMVLSAVGVILTIMLGGASKVRGEYRAELAKVHAEQARARAEQQRRQASEERLRIARELHDVLGHHLSLINVQAGVGLHLMDSRPEQAREALAAIKTASAEALREVRAVLGVLRPEEEAAPRQPAVGLAQLGALTAGAGFEVRTTVVGEPRELPAEVDRAAYRIVQEALTNVRRHAAADSAVQVTVDYRSTALVVTVRNDGPETGSSGPFEGGEGTSKGGAGTGPRTAEGAGIAQDAGTAEGGAGAGEGGSGIAGMRARAQSLGGTVEAAPTPDGGFQVCAVLPTRGTP